MVPGAVRSLARRLEKHRQRAGFVGMLRACVMTPYYLVRYYPEKRRFRQEMRVKAAAALAFDRRYGTDTAGVVKQASLDVAGETWVHAGPYQGIDEREFHAIMRALPIRHEDFTFVDIGSGKGKALLLASRYPFRKIRGVEFSQALHRAACRNVSVFRDEGQACADIEPICMDATRYELPAEACLLFLYNPFEAAVMRPFVERLARSLAAAPRPTVILYLNPTEAALFDACPAVRCVEDAGRYRVYTAGYAWPSTGR